MPSNDYILRSDALEHFGNYLPGYSIPKDEVIRGIEELPAADVEGKRMTGVWLEQDETPNIKSNKLYRCSICGYADEQSPSAEVPFCWHCGSKMKKIFKGKEKEDDSI